MIIILKNIFALIKKDTIVLYPAMITTLLISWTIFILKVDLKNIKTLLIYALVSWLLNIYVQLITAAIGRELLNNKKIFFGKCLKESFARYLPTLFWTGLILFFISGVFFISRENKILSLLSVPLIFILSTAFQMYPIIYTASQKSAQRSFIALYTFFSKKFKVVIHLFLFIIFSSFLTIIFISFLEYLPKQISAVVAPMLQGIFNVAVTYAVLLLWKFNSSTIKVKA